MMIRSPRLLAVGCVVGGVGLAFGCARQRPFDDLWVAARPYQAELDAARPLTDALDTRTRVRAVSEDPPLPNPTGEVTLHEAIALALRHSPGLRASGWAVLAVEADALQLGRPPNPRAGFSAENIAGPSAGTTFDRQTLRLSQVIELGGKRAKRQALGEATQRLAAWDYEERRIEVAATTAGRFVTVVVAQERIALAEQQLRLAESGLAIAMDRAGAGTAPGRERDQASARVALSRIALERARREHEAAMADLAGSWGAGRARFEGVTGDLGQRIDPPTLDELEGRLAKSPHVARWADEIAQRQRDLELQQAKAIADPTVGAGVRYFPDADDVAGVVELSIPLQVFDDNRHGVFAARLRVAQARAQQQEARASAGRELARAYARYEAAAYALDAIDQEALPASESAYRAALGSYEAGLTDYLTALDAERTLLQTRSQRLDAASEYHLAVIEIEHLTATAVAGEVSQPE